MSVRLEVSVPVVAEAHRVWAELTDWAGQRRWIPFTTVRVLQQVAAPGAGTRVEALSGFRLGRIPIGLLDRFMVTGWTPPEPPDSVRPGELEVLHLGPHFTGDGVFRVERTGSGSLVTCAEVFNLPGGRVTEAVARLALPLLRRGLTVSLRRLAGVSEAPA